MTRRDLIIVVLAAMSCGMHAVSACEIRVRDSAFRTARDVHRLCIIASPDDVSADKIEERLRQRLAAIEGDFNVQVERIDASDPDVDWNSIGIPSAPPQVPVTVLVGRDNGNASRFVIDHWQPGPTDDELAALIDSPKRKQLARQLANHLAVVISAPRETRDPADDLVPALTASLADERIGLSVIRLDRSDPAERLLLRFMGIRPGNPDTLCVAFGRGKLMTPPLIGDDINQANVESLVALIRQACSCSKPLSTMGVDLPLIWSDTIDSGVVLMDEALDLDELDAEVQQMLELKASTSELAETSNVSIPPGRGARPSIEPAIAASPPRVIVIAGLVGIGFVFLVLRFLWQGRLRSSG